MSIDLEKIGQMLWDLDLWPRFNSDLLLNVSTILTEPVCPVATIRFEFPENAGMDIVASAVGNTIEEAIENAVALAMIKLKEDTSA